MNLPDHVPELTKPVPVDDPGHRQLGLTSPTWISGVRSCMHSEDEWRISVIPLNAMLANARDESIRQGRALEKKQSQLAPAQALPQQQLNVPSILLHQQNQPNRNHQHTTWEFLHHEKEDKRPQTRLIFFGGPTHSETLYYQGVLQTGIFRLCPSRGQIVCALISTLVASFDIFTYWIGTAQGYQEKKKPVL